MRITNAITASMLVLTIMAVLVYAGQSGPSPVPSPPGYNLTTTATTLCRGITNYIPITIKNYGQGSVGSMQDTMLNLLSTPGVYATNLDVGTIPANATETFYMPVFVYANASLFIPTGISINYYYYVLYTDSEVKNVTFTVTACPQPITASISPEVITAGDIDNITFNITNTGSYTLNGLSVSLSLPSADAALLGSQPIDIASIAPHNSITIRQRIYVSKNATQNFPANLTVDYYNGTTLNQAWNDSELLTIGIINLTESSLTLSPTVPSPGSIFSISMVLTNTGTSGASAVTAAVSPTSGFSSYGGNSVFVGSIGADSQVPVTLTLVANSSVKNGQYQIPIQIDYLNSLRQNVSQRITVPVQLAASNTLNITAITTGRRGSGGGLILLILIIIIIVLLVLYYKERKKNKRHVK